MPIITDTDWTRARPPHQYNAMATTHWTVAQKILSRAPTFLSFDNNVETTYEPESDEVIKKRHIVNSAEADSMT